MISDFSHQMKPPTHDQALTFPTAHPPRSRPGYIPLRTDLGNRLQRHRQDAGAWKVLLFPVKCRIPRGKGAEIGVISSLGSHFLFSRMETRETRKKREGVCKYRKVMRPCDEKVSHEETRMLEWSWCWLWEPGRLCGFSATWQGQQWLVLLTIHNVKRSYTCVCCGVL